MKRKILSIVALVILNFAFTSGAPSSEAICELNAEQNGEMVYICTGSQAYRYHKSRGCRGLNNCRGEIIKISRSTAKDKGFTPCKICYK